MQNKQAFTLIELLVVVLIIGILAAVALPQYQLAVEKSRAVQAITTVNTLMDALERYYLANGAYPTDMTLANLNQLLDVEVKMPSGWTFWSPSAEYISMNRDTSHFTYSIGKMSSYHVTVDTKPGLLCWTQETTQTNSLSARLCKNLCKTNTLRRIWGSGQYGCQFS